MPWQGYALMSERTPWRQPSVNGLARIGRPRERLDEELSHQRGTEEHVHLRPARAGHFRVRVVRGMNVGFHDTDYTIVNKPVQIVKIKMENDGAKLKILICNFDF